MSRAHRVKTRRRTRFGEPEALKGLIPPDPSNQLDRNEILEGMLTVERDGKWYDVVSGEEVADPKTRRYKPGDFWNAFRRRFGNLPEADLIRLQNEAYEKAQQANHERPA